LSLVICGNVTSRVVLIETKADPEEGKSYQANRINQEDTKDIKESAAMKKYLVGSDYAAGGMRIVIGNFCSGVKCETSSGSDYRGDISIMSCCPTSEEHLLDNL